MPWKKKIVLNEKKVELDDEYLDKVTGGIFIQPEREWTCIKCGKNFDNAEDRRLHERICKG